jgi:CheY-like chemotaxis protein
MELGADDYLTKPFEETELLNAVEGRLRRSELFRKGFDAGFDGLNRFFDQARGVAALSDLNKDRKTRKVGYMGLLENGRAGETAECMEDCEVAMVPREDLLALLYRDRDVSIRFIKMLAHDVKEKEQHLLQMAYASVRQRVAQVIIRLHERYAQANDAGLGVRISREDLATIVGTATESLIRCLADLRDEGLVEAQGRDLRIVDMPRLKKVAQG